jgi:diguanylate cyclase (GGDEF)-like protein/PAS domain S-box-containing protein
LGYTAEALIGQSIFSLVHPDDQERLMAVIALGARYKDSDPIEENIQVSVQESHGDANSSPEQAARSWNSGRKQDSILNSSVELTTSKSCNYRVICQNGKIVWVRAIATVLPNTNPNPSILLVWEDYTESHKIEEVLRESEYQYYILTKLAPVGIFRTDTEGYSLYVNERWCEITGISLEEALGESWIQSIHPDDRERIYAQWFRATQENQPFQSDYRFGRPNGKTCWVIGDVSPEKGEKGEVRGYIGTISDITERKQVEEALQQWEHQLAAIAANIPGSVYRATLQPDGTMTLAYISAGVLELTGIHPQEALADPERLLEIIHPEDRQKFNEFVRLSIETQQPFHHQFRIISTFGQVKLVRNIARFSRTDNGDLVADGVFLDISDVYGELHLRQQAEEALRQSEARYRAIIEDQTELICRYLPDGTLTFVNEAYCRYFSQQRQELIGSNFIAFIQNADGQAVETYLTSFNPDIPVRIVEQQVVMPNGEIRIQQWNDRAIFDEQGCITEFQSVGRDITLAKQAEEALKESREKYRVLFQLFPIGISITDESGKIIEANSVSEKILGLSIEEDIQIKYDSEKWQVLRPDGTPMPVNEYASVRALKEKRIIENVEKKIVKPGNEISWISVTAAPIPLEGYGVAIAYFDITKRKQAEESLRQSEERYRYLFNSGNDAIFVHGFTSAGIPTRYTEVNDIACQILGYTREELLQLSPLDIHAPEKAGEVPAIVEKLFAKKHHLFEMVMQTKEGRKIPIEVNAHLFELNRQPTVLWIVRDISERKHTLERLRKQFLRERLMGRIQRRIRQSLDLTEILNTTVTEVRQFLQTDRVVIYRFEPDWSGVVIVESVDLGWTPTLGRILFDACLAKETLIQSYRRGRIQALEDIYALSLPKCYVDFLAQFQVRANLVVPILQGDKLWGLLIAHHCAQKRQWLSWEIELLKQLAIQVGIAIQQAELYQQLEAANQELKRLATLDGLTQLANRRRFDEYLEQEWWRLAREQQPLSLILCDIDFFKRYNDTYGHQAGDECLKQVAVALQRSVKRPADVVARYGGEEFAVILPHTADTGALCLAELIREEVRNLSLTHAGSNVSSHITLSLGVAGMIPQLDATFADLVAAADAALYEAKASGRDRVVLR